MIVTHRFSQESPSCAYLPNEESRLEYELAQSISPQEYEDRMNAGWRKFGMLLFHPTCSSCSACRPIRILAKEFQPDRSQRRALKSNADLQILISPAIVDDARIALYRKYHAAQSVRKGWELEIVTTEDYAFRFLYSSVPAVEISIWDAGALCAVAITDVTPNAVSGVYHYHDPDRLDRSLGTFVVLQTIELARRLAKPYAYFGYYVADCGSLAYKARFQPCEILEPDGQWRRMNEPANQIRPGG